MGPRLSRITSEMVLVQDLPLVLHRISPHSPHNVFHNLTILLHVHDSQPLCTFPDEDSERVGLTINEIVLQSLHQNVST